MKHANIRKVVKEVTQLFSDFDIEINLKLKKTPVTIELALSLPRNYIKEKDNKETDISIEDDIEKILQNIKRMEVDDNNEDRSENEKKLVRLKSVLKIKGLDMNQHKLVRVVGGGQCGLNCILLHTTGSEEMAKENASIKNQHTVENWEHIYKKKTVLVCLY